MNCFFTEEQLSKICGNLIRDERKARKKSAMVIAELAGLSQQYLSEIERGTRKVSDAAMMELCAVLTIDFNSEHNVMDDADKVFKDCLRYLSDFDYIHINASLEQLLCDKYKYSYAYSYYQCALLLKNMFIKKKKLTTPVMQKEIETNDFLKAYICFVNSKITEKVSDVDAGLKMCAEGDLAFTIIRGLLLNEKASILENNQEFRSALIFYEKSKELYQSLYLITGTLSTEMNIANLYSRLGEYQESKRIYTRISYIAERNDITRISNAAKINLAYNSMILGDYCSCIDEITRLVKKIGAIPDEYNIIYYLLAYSHFMLGAERKTVEYCQEALAKIPTDDFPYKIIYLIIISLDNKELSESNSNIDLNPDAKLILDYFDETIENGDIGDITIIYNLLNKYFKSKNHTELALVCSERFIKYLTV